MASIQFTHSMEIVMKRKSIILAATAAAAVAAFGLVLVNGNDTLAHPIKGQGSFYGQGYGMGQGNMMMGRRGGGRMMGAGANSNTWPGAVWADADKNGTLTIEEVKTFIETRHAAMGNTGFKPGEVTQKDENTLSVQMLDAAGNVVRTMEFPTKVNQAATNQPGYGQGYGMRGGQMGRGHAMHGGKMGGGYGMRGGQMGGGYGMGFGTTSATPVTVDQVKSMVIARLAMGNNPNLKVGEVTEKDENTISAEIVTLDGSLVQRLEFDRKTGRANMIR
jgi:hypothetical protein